MLDGQQFIGNIFILFLDHAYKEKSSHQRNVLQFATMNEPRMHMGGRNRNSLADLLADFHGLINDIITVRQPKLQLFSLEFFGLYLQLGDGHEIKV